jgi:hypothetical protein
MAKVILNPLLDGLHGRVGNLVFRRTSTGKTTMYARPEKSQRIASEAQKAQRERFKQAVAYAYAAMAEPNVRAHYEEQAAKVKKTPFSLAVSDYFKDRNLLEK